MKRSLMLPHPCLLIAACTSPQTDTPDSKHHSRHRHLAGQQVYNTFCAACHDGGDETAPELDELHALGRDARHRRALAGRPHGAAVRHAQRGAARARHRLPVRAAAGTPQFANADLSTDPTGATAAPMSKAFPIPPAASATSATARTARARPRGRRRNSAMARSSSNPGNSATCASRSSRAASTSPRAIEFLPNGDVLVAERTGQLRIVRNGKLDPAPIAGTPKSPCSARPPASWM